MSACPALPRTPTRDPCHLRKTGGTTSRPRQAGLVAPVAQRPCSLRRDAEEAGPAGSVARPDLTAQARLEAAVDQDEAGGKVTAADPGTSADLSQQNPLRLRSLPRIRRHHASTAAAAAVHGRVRRLLANWCPCPSRRWHCPKTSSPYLCSRRRALRPHRSPGADRDASENS